MCLSTLTVSAIGPSLFWFGFRVVCRRMLLPTMSDQFIHMSVCLLQFVRFSSSGSVRPIQFVHMSNLAVQFVRFSSFEFNFSLSGLDRALEFVRCRLSGSVHVFQFLFRFRAVNSS